MGKIVQRTSDQSAVASTRNKLKATDRAASIVAPGDTTDLAIARAQGSAYVARSVEPETLTSSQTLTTGKLRLVAIWLPNSANIASIFFGLGTAGGTLTSSGFNGVCLYGYDRNADSDQITLIAQSSNAVSIFNSTQVSGSFVPVNLTTTPMCGRGVYYAGIALNTSAGTAPQLLSSPIPSGNITNLSNSGLGGPNALFGVYKFGRAISVDFTGSTPPATISRLTPGNNASLVFMGLLSGG